ncbi:phytoene/squalene synthase family protein [Nocardia implantans]|uniref:Phytoene/squalene synthase family protein n=1 Tax=Nocardia implantans TaxID=3108168 RepID=A0ABU6AQW6_9NOCA|nr:MULTISPECIES: phytoene/squalene synthase family protein [unclassified Nocardia]MBF6190206.1 phytoene/squalene synthase family protein [Nocardia beijingensis]MEA3532732.1 phytoene/squalene synthase family protein [Nocardia sp. CDC192]MEB3509863.1 phytoene/squalene synthase family protein [Nocardia sp. CDC186]
MTEGRLSGSALLPLAYRECRQIAATHGRTYFLATRLLSAERRPAVHALYAFARMVDDVVDRAARPHDGGPAAELDSIERDLRVALESRSGVAAQHASSAEHGESWASVPRPRDLVLAAVTHTIHRYGIAPQHFWTFLDSMRMDAPGAPTFRNRYGTMAQLREYMRGSAAAIGLQLLPVLGTVVPVSAAEPAAAALGEAFQLTNFLRDVAEDLDRDRVYLPADAIAAFGVDEELLFECRRTGRTDPRVRRALAHLIAVNRDLYRRAEPGIDLLEPRVRPAIRTAATLYADILHHIERSDYAVFDHRAVVPRHHRLRIAATEFTTATLRDRLAR